MALVWQAEAKGVWTVKGGISSVAKAIERLAEDRGVEFIYGHQGYRNTTIKALG